VAIGRLRLANALLKARAQGLVRMDGERGKATYSAEYGRQHPSASMGDLLADLGASRPHLKQALRQARENGQIELIGQWRGARYRAVGGEAQPPG
jgi:phosphatidylserine/phosphatidylglycerophosphate/cardiolipin synthase-like enzyme